MFFFESFQSGSRCFTTLAAYTIAASLGTVCLATDPQPKCHFKGAVFAGEPMLQNEAEQAGSTCFDLTIDEPGWTLIFIGDVLGGESDSRRLDVEGPLDVKAKALHQTSNSLLFAVAPATYQIRVSAEDPAKTLGPYVLKSSFVSVSQAREAWAAGGGLETWLHGQGGTEPCDQAADSEVDDDRGIEVVIDPFADPCFSKGDSETGDERGIEVVIDPFTDSCGQPSGIGVADLSKGADFSKGEGDDDRGIEVVIDPFAGPCESGSQLEVSRDQARAEVLADLCSALTLDEHGDTFACASALSFDQQIHGSRWAGEADADVFTFWVDDRSTVIADAEADGGFELQLTVYDHHGQALGQPSGRSGSRWVGTLMPGQYFVGVGSGHEVDGAEVDGAYVLELRRR